jgi:hypothetical protein
VKRDDYVDEYVPEAHVQALRRVTGAAGKTIGETVVESTNAALRPAAEQVINFLVSSKVGDSDNTATIAPSLAIV